MAKIDTEPTGASEGDGSSSNPRVSRRSILRKTFAGAALSNPAARIFLSIVSGAVVATDETACGIESKPTNEAETAVDSVIKKVFTPLVTRMNDADADNAATLVSPALHTGDYNGVLSVFNYIKGHSFSLQGSQFGIELSPMQSASLTSAGVSEGLNAHQTAEAFVNAYQAYTSAPNPEGIDNSLDANFGGSDSDSDVVIGLVGLDQVFQNGVTDVIAEYEHLARFAYDSDDFSKNVIKAQPAALALARKIRKDGKLQEIIDNANDFYENTNVGNDDYESPAILALAVEFAGGNSAALSKVKDAYQTMKSQYDDPTISLMLTLASVIDGFDANRIQQMYDYARTYNSAAISTPTENQAAKIVLATAAQEAIQNGKLPPEIQQIDTTVNILPLIIVWYFFFRG